MDSTAEALARLDDLDIGHACLRQGQIPNAKLGLRPLRYSAVLQNSRHQTRHAGADDANLLALGSLHVDRAQVCLCLKQLDSIKPGPQNIDARVGRHGATSLAGLHAEVSNKLLDGSVNVICNAAIAQIESSRAGCLMASSTHFSRQTFAMPGSADVGNVSTVWVVK